MDWQRNLLVGAIIVVLALLFVRWNEFSERRSETKAAAISEEVVVPGEDQVSGTVFPEPAAIPGAESAPAPAIAAGSGRLITLTSDTLRLVIDTQGGDIVRAELLNFPKTLKEGSDPFVVLNRSKEHTYIAQSGLVGADGTDTNEGRPRFTVVSDNLSLDPGENELVVDLAYRQGSSAKITKRFTLKRGQYLVGVDYVVENTGNKPWRASMFGQIQRDDYRPPAAGVGMKPYVGAAITTDETNYKKISFDDLQDNALKTVKEGGWVAMVQHYFISAWIPDQSSSNSYSLRKLGGSNIYALGYTSPQEEVAPGATGVIESSFYVGPKNQYRLEEISPFLDLTVDYGWLWWLAKPIFYLLTLIHSYVGNWGWSIILLTVIIKLGFFKLSAASYRSMAKMRKLQPEMGRLKDLYGDDRQKLSQEMMAFYKKEKVNPLGGCLPILIQMPVFIALYWVLSESVELRQAPWILWIEDLSVKDPYFVLPVLNGIAMFVTTLLQPEPPDPTQAKVMKIMPVAFSFLFAFFPAGLVLYWTVNSVLSIAQQWAITRKVEAGG